MVGLMVDTMSPPTCGDVDPGAPGGSSIGRRVMKGVGFITASIKPFITRVITSFVNRPTRMFVSASRS
jgi:hypothetical protein